MNFLKKSTIGLVIAGAIVFLFSPYRSTKGNVEKIVSSIHIKTNACEAFEYLGNSSHASDWSSFVSHIDPLEGVDGETGSKRRCFTDDGAEAWRWDEEIIEKINCKKRKLSIYKLVNFPLVANGLMTEQIYEITSREECKLSLTLFFEEKTNLFNYIKMKMAAYYIESIFDKNLNNIKSILENKSHAEIKL